MKLIIDIPEDLYKGIECRNPELETEYVCYELMKAVDNGTPLDDVKAENKGEWKSEDERVPLEESLLFRCSECNKVSFWQTNFCSNCGADMRGGKDEIIY